MKRCLSPIILVTSFIYYLILCAKEYTWIFVSGDSGDWLAASVAWMVPQTYGSPLYISLGRLISVFSNNLPLHMTILLSVIPAAFTVFFTYLIIRKLTSVKIALTCSTVLLGSAVFLSQSTVLEEYALTTMFLTGAYWFYINEQKYLTPLFLGLGTAIHIFILPLAFFWLLCDRRWKIWLWKPLLIYIVSGVLPYTLILILMAADTPKFLAGYLNLQSVLDYWTMTSRAIVGQLSLFEAPERFWFFVRLTCMSFGLALLPIFVSLRKPITRNMLVLISICLFTFWYVITNLDINAWTFLTFTAPSLVILCGIGLSRLRGWHTIAIAGSAIILIITNSIFLNANTLSQQNPQAMTYYNELHALPKNSTVVTSPGARSLGLFYVINEGRDLIPLIYPYLDKWNFTDYGRYLNERYGVNWADTLEGVQDTLAKNRQAYFVYDISSPLVDCFTLEGEGSVREIKALTGTLPKEDFKWIK